MPEVAKPGEVLEKRTANSHTFKRANGSRRVVATAIPSSYEDRGELVALDATPVSADGVNWTTVSTPYVLQWDSQRAALSYESKAGGRAQVRLVALDGKPFLAGNGIARVEGRRIKAQVAPQLEIHLGVFHTGVEIFKLLRGPAAPRSLTWEVTEPVGNPLKVNLMGTTGQDNVEHRDKRAQRGEGLIRRPIEMRHEMGPETTDGVTRTYTVTETWTGRTRKLDPDTMARSWVDDAAYPVEIDVTVNEAIVADADNGHGYGASSYWRSNNVSNTQAAPAWKIGLRFQTVDIPNAATINSATLTIRVTFRSGTGNQTLNGQAVDDAPSWADASANSPGTMAATTASTTYALPGTTGIKTIDVTSIVQEIVNRAGWTNNNDIRLGFTDVSGLSAGAYMYLEKLVDAGTDEAKLDIDYTVAAATLAPPPYRTQARRIAPLLGF